MKKFTIAVIAIAILLASCVTTGGNTNAKTERWNESYNGPNAVIYKDLKGREYRVKSTWDLPAGNYIHPSGYFTDIYYNADGFKVVDSYYRGGQHTITTSRGHAEHAGWIRQGVSAGFVYAPNKIYDEFRARWINTYNTDREFRKLVDICIKIANESRYDWDFWYNGIPHDINRGFICDDYARVTRDTLAAMGYDVKIVSSRLANHAWNEVILPDGRKVYVDVTWFDYDFDSTNRTWKTQEYSIGNIVLENDVNIFNYGFAGRRRIHYAFGDAVYR